MSTTTSGAIGEFIARHGRRASVAAGTPLFHEGDRSLSVFACVEGRVRIFVDTALGREVVIGFRDPGEQFGEFAALTRRPRAASATTTQESVIAHMPGERFLAALESEPGLAFTVLRSLAEQIEATNARLLARTCESAGSRVGHKLAELTMLRRRHAGRDARDRSLDITQAELANWTGTTRESVSRALREFRRRGLVETGRCRITVTDVPALIRFAESL